MTILATCQVALQVGHLSDNAVAIEAAVTAAADSGAEIVVLPELADSGYVFADRAEATALAATAERSPTLRAWRRLAAARDITIVGGWCELGVGGKLFNSAAIVGPSGVLATYRKAHLWDTEQNFFTAGDASPIVDTPAGRIGVCICYDLEFPEWVRLAALAGADLLAAPANWPVMPRPSDERPIEVAKAQAMAAANGIWIAVADRCGTERAVDWIGGSVVVGPDGYPVAGPVLADRPETLVVDIDLLRARDKRITPRNDAFKDRRVDLYGGKPRRAAP